MLKVGGSEKIYRGGMAIEEVYLEGGGGVCKPSALYEAVVKYHLKKLFNSHKRWSKTIDRLLF